MKAAVVHEYGGPEVLRYEDFPDPVAGEGQVLVKLAATCVNPIDIKRRSGFAKEIYPINFPGILGLDVAGTVVKVGQGVSGFTEGEQVLAMVGPSYAELCPVAASAAVKLPTGLDIIDAAALPTIATTGYTLISQAGQVKAGQKVLITGAVGMVGRCALYAAKKLGAYVIAAVRSQDASEAEALGADEVITTDDLSGMNSLPSVDVVADTVGGTLAEAVFPRINPSGIYATVTLAKPFDGKFPSVRRAHVRTQPNASFLLEMALAFRDGLLKIPIGLRVPLSQAPMAHAAVENRSVRGKVLVVVGE